MSSAPAAVVEGQTPGGVPPLVIEPACVRTTVVDSSVRDFPSTRTDTVVPAASAVVLGTRTNASAAPLRARIFLWCMRATPFREGILAWRSEAGLLAYGPTSRAFPVAARHQWLVLRLASPITVAGPRRIFTGFPSPPTGTAGILARRGAAGRGGAGR